MSANSILTSSLRIPPPQVPTTPGTSPHVFGFPKNVRSNIDKDETQALKKLAVHLLSLPAQALSTAKQAGELIEVDCDAKD